MVITRVNVESQLQLEWEYITSCINWFPKKMIHHYMVHIEQDKKMKLKWVWVMKERCKRSALISRDLYQPNLSHAITSPPRAQDHIMSLQSQLSTNKGFVYQDVQILLVIGINTLNGPFLPSCLVTPRFPTNAALQTIHLSKHPIH